MGGRHGRIVPWTTTAVAAAEEEGLGVAGGGRQRRRRGFVRGVCMTLGRVSGRQSKGFFIFLAGSWV